MNKNRIIMEHIGAVLNTSGFAVLATEGNGQPHTSLIAITPFGNLRQIIFGGNEANTKTSMTTPVQMDINDSVSTMSFVMPSAYKKESLPKPNDPGVQIKNSPKEYVAVEQEPKIAQ